MTLTAIIPSLRTSIPDPLDVNLWPELTTATTTDVIVAGVSLLRLVEVCDTVPYRRDRGASRRPARR
jgi:hypothetical protein